MLESSGDRRAPITPQLAMRVAILGGIAFALFAIVFFRLWYLQVLSGDKYLAQATVNRVRDLRIQAPRGKIVDRNGRVIVRNRQAVVVQLDPSTLPQVERDLAAEWGRKMGLRAARLKGERGEPIKIPPIPTEDLKRRYARLAKVLDTTIKEEGAADQKLTKLARSVINVKAKAAPSKSSQAANKREQSSSVGAGVGKALSQMVKKVTG